MMVVTLVALMVALMVEMMVEMMVELLVTYLVALSGPWMAGKMAAWSAKMMVASLV